MRTFPLLITIALAGICLFIAVLYGLNQKQAANLSTLDAGEMFPNIPNSYEGTMPTRAGTSTNVATSTPPPPPRDILNWRKVEELADKGTPISNENEYRLKRTPLYTVYFISHAHYLSVVVSHASSSEAIREAEAYLREELGATAEELCGLNIDVFDAAVSAQGDAVDLGLSACPGPRAPLGP